MPYYKILTADAGQRNLGDPAAWITTEDFKEVLKAKGRKTLSDPRLTFSYRSRTDRPKVFKGLPSTYTFPARIKLEDLAAANNIEGYVRAWRSTNHLTQ